MLLEQLFQIAPEQFASSPDRRRRLWPNALDHRCVDRCVRVAQSRVSRHQTYGRLAALVSLNAIMVIARPSNTPEETFDGLCIPGRLGHGELSDLCKLLGLPLSKAFCDARVEAN